MRDHFIKRLLERALADQRIILVTGDLGFGVFDEYRRTLPMQFLNAGVCEQNMAGLATGMALEGKVVFIYSIANFPTLRCLEQIRNDVCYHGANVKIVSVGGGFSYGALGVSHHATEDLAILRTIPEIKVLAPGDDWETVAATDALVDTPGPFYLRLDKSSAGYTGRPGETFQLGRARVLRQGTDITLVASGGILEEALRAADSLARDGIECRVLSMHTIKPLDGDSLEKAALETGGILTIEEHTVYGGLGSAVAETMLERGVVPKWFYRVGLRDGFSSTIGDQQYLRNVYAMDCDAIKYKCKEILGPKVK